MLATLLCFRAQAQRHAEAPSGARFTKLATAPRATGHGPADPCEVGGSPQVATESGICRGLALAFVMTRRPLCAALLLLQNKQKRRKHELWVSQIPNLHIRRMHHEPTAPTEPGLALLCLQRCWSKSDAG